VFDADHRVRSEVAPEPHRQRQRRAVGLGGREDDDLLAAQKLLDV